MLSQRCSQSQQIFQCYILVAETTILYFRMFQCGQCLEQFPTFRGSVFHSLESHRDSNIEIQENYLCEKTGLERSNRYIFDIFPNNISQDCTIDVNESAQTIKLTVPGINGDPQEVQQTPCSQEPSHDSTDVEDNADSDYVHKCFENAIPKLKDSGCLDKLVLFLNLVADEKFPLDNILFYFKASKMDSH